MSERLTRGLAAMFGGDDPASETVEAALATPTGQALAALVKAAEAWRYSGSATGGADELEAAFDAWLAATEETT